MSADVEALRAELVAAWQAHRAEPWRVSIGCVGRIALRLEAAVLPPAGPDPVEWDIPAPAPTNQSAPSEFDCGVRTYGRTE